MSDRRAFLDRGVGETRGVVTLDGRPERLLIHRDDDDPFLRVGARVVARVAQVDAALATAFVDLGQGRQAVLNFRPDEKPVRGAALELEVRTEPRRGKLATLRPLGPAEGAPRLIAPAPEVAELVSRLARVPTLTEGRAAREQADAAEAEALEMLHPLPGGGEIAIEPTRALVAVDVDVGARGGSDAKRVTRAANLAALAEAARLLRLKGLGGLVVIDLAGRGHEATALLAAARLAFAPDNPGVAMGQIGRFGTLELTLPRRERSVIERLLGEDGQPTALALAHRLMRRLLAEGEAQGGARLVARCAPDVADAARSLAPGLAARIGARFEIEAQPAFSRDRLDVAAR
ncbi:ribonuclease E/G [Phenylobacterium sp.]|uniref:ribonuclease E/G n=1 Tax=Phenylobacterium sp. TaxID=1871053 RepID=UPI0037CB4B22